MKLTTSTSKKNVKLIETGDLNTYIQHFFGCRFYTLLNIVILEHALCEDILWVKAPVPEVRSFLVGLLLLLWGNGFWNFPPYKPTLVITPGNALVARHYTPDLGLQLQFTGYDASFSRAFPHIRTNLPVMRVNYTKWPSKEVGFQLHVNMLFTISKNHVESCSSHSSPPQPWPPQKINYSHIYIWI
jgi:hypothetical protein